jgi:hypothetical protein
MKNAWFYLAMETPTLAVLPLTKGYRGSKDGTRSSRTNNLPPVPSWLRLTQ